MMPTAQSRPPWKAASAKQTARPAVAVCALVCQVAALLLAQCQREQPQLVFRVGSALGDNAVGSCATNHAMVQGYTQFLGRLDLTPISFVSGTGAKYHIHFNYSNIDDGCEPERHDAAITGLLHQQHVHFLLGGLGSPFGSNDSDAANAAQRIMYHCCVSPDELFEKRLPYVFGTFFSNRKYTEPVMKAMAFQGIRTVFFVGNADDLFTSTTMAAAMRQVEMVQQFRPDFRVIQVVDHAQGVDATWWAALAQRVAASGADALMAFEDPPTGLLVVRALKEQGVYLKAVYVTWGPASETFRPLLGSEVENVVSSSQWQPTVPYADVFFGTARHFASDYEARFGEPPDYQGAGAAVTLYVLATAIQTALSGCDLSLAQGDVDQVLFNESAIVCKTQGPVSIPSQATGYARVRDALAATSLNTFFGPIEMNSKQRNGAGTVVIVQVQQAKVRSVLPIEAADAALIMPLPRPHTEPRWASTTAGVVIIVLATALAATALVAGVALAYWRRSLRRMQASTEAVAVVQVQDLEDLRPPRWPPAGPPLAGLALYRGTKVALVPFALPTHHHTSMLRQRPRSGGVHRHHPQASSPPPAPGRSPASRPPADSPGGSRRGATGAALPAARAGAGAADPNFVFTSGVRLDPADACDSSGGGTRQEEEKEESSSAAFYDRFSFGRAVSAYKSGGGNSGFGLPFDSASAPTVVLGMGMASPREEEAEQPEQVILEDDVQVNGVPPDAPAALPVARGSVGRYLSAATIAESVAAAPPAVELSPASVRERRSRESNSRVQSWLRLRVRGGGISGGCMGAVAKEAGDSKEYNGGDVGSAAAGAAGGGGSSPRGGAASALHVSALHHHGGGDHKAAVRVALCGMRLQHSGVLPVLGVVLSFPGMPPKCGLLVRSLCEFGDLCALLENETLELDGQRKADIAQQVAAAMAYLHRQAPPLALGDLAPRRILLDRYFRARIDISFHDLHAYTMLAAAAAASSATAAATSTPAAAAATILDTAATLPPMAGGALAAAGAAAGSGGSLTGDAAAAVMTPQQLQQLRMAADVRGFGYLLLTLFGFYSEGSPSSSTATMPCHDNAAPKAPGATTPSSAPPSTSFARQAAPGGSRPPRPPKSHSGRSLHGRLSSFIEFATLASSSSKHARTQQQLLLQEFPAALPLQPRPPSQQQQQAASPAQLQADAGRGECMAQESVASAAAARASRASIAGAGVLAYEEITASLPAGVQAQQAQAAGVCGGSPPRDLHRPPVQEALGKVYRLHPPLAALAEQCLVADPFQRPSFEVIEMTLAGMVGELNRVVMHRQASSRWFGDASERGLPPDPSQAATPSERSTGRTSITQAFGSMIKRANQNEALLYEIFPPKVARALQAGEEVQPERYECVSVLFTDICGYTNLCSCLPPLEVMAMLHRLYTAFDAACREMGLFKVETIGDAYMAVSNLRWPQPHSHARLLAHFAFRLVATANSLLVAPDRPELGRLHIRVGLHSGPVVASCVGTLNRRYCLFGDTVNVASRMESSSEQDRLHCSAAFAALLREQWPEAPLTSRGAISVKGKGAMETCWVARPPGFDPMTAPTHPIWEEDTGHSERPLHRLSGSQPGASPRAAAAHTRDVCANDV